MNPNIKTRHFILVLLLALLISCTGCLSSFTRVHSDENKDMEKKEFYRPCEEELPEEIKEWVNRSLSMNMGQSKIYEEELYILVTYGERPTGGYSVKIEDVISKKDYIEVEVYFKAPEKGDLVTQAITYPYDLVVVKDPPSLPVKFQVKGDEDFLRVLKGIDTLEPITAESPRIKVFEPSPNEDVERDFEIRGIASVYEGNIEFEIYDDEGNNYKGYTRTGEEGWNYFRVPVKVPEEIQGRFSLELYSFSPLDGNKESLVTLFLNLKKE